MRLSSFFCRTAVALAAVVMLTPAAQAGDTCKDVTVKVTNGHDAKVQIMSFEFYDYDKERWRSEKLDHTFSDHTLKPGEAKTYLRNLQGVKNDQTRIRLTYLKEVGGIFKADQELSIDGAKHKCEDAEINTLTLR